MDTFDYVIVGAGSAGSVLANRLSADGRTTVCVLEAGPSDWLPWIHIPAGFIKTFYHPKVNWLYSMEPSEPGPAAGASTRRAAKRSAARRRSTATSTIAASAWTSTPGRSSAIAAGAMPTCCPTSSGWKTAIGDGDPTFRGKEGALTVTDIDWIHPLCEAFIAGAESIGIPRNPDYNGATQEGVSYSQRTIYKGRRMSAARAFLHPAMKRANLTVRTHAHATEIVLRGQARRRRALCQGRTWRPAEGGARGEGADPVRRHL